VTQLATPQTFDRATVLPDLRIEAKARRSCRSCGDRSLERVLDLGNLYISGFADVPDPSSWPKVPLELLLCPSCGLVQLRHTTPPEWMYRRYWYKSGVSATMRAALADVTARARQFAPLRRGDAVLDIGCNDGTLLGTYAEPGIRRVGFEPAANLAAEAESNADHVVRDFFSAGPVAGDEFRIVTSIAMFYDLEDPNAFCADVASVLAEDGVWIIEMHYLADIVQQNAFDAICHEHLEYYSLAALENVVERAGLRVADVETNSVNGGSLRAYVVRRESPEASVQSRVARVESLRRKESNAELNRVHTYAHLESRIHQIGSRLNRWLAAEHARRKRISAYGASTKGNTLLQAFGLDRSLIRSAAERNPEKWGKHTVGSWIPIVSEAEARKSSDIFLILPWHFLAEIRERESEWLAHGGALVAPLPTPALIDKSGMSPVPSRA
jgi:NDP-4-keto-2,6-dideoxyhexose 3-C-methyltransferase